MKKLIQAKDYLLFVDEEAEIKEGDTVYENISGVFAPYEKEDVVENPIKVIAYYPLTKEAKELDLPLLPEFNNIETRKIVASQQYALSQNSMGCLTKLKNAWIDGFDTAQTLGTFTLEDMKKAIEMARNISDGKDTFTGEDISGLTEVCTYDWVQTYSDEEIIQSLSTQQSPVSFEPEYDIVHTDHAPNGFEKLLKFKTNSEGKEEIQGTYKY